MFVIFFISAVVCRFNDIWIVKRKLEVTMAWNKSNPITGLEGSRRLRLTDFKTIDTGR